MKWFLRSALALIIIGVIAVLGSAVRYFTGLSWGWSIAATTVLTIAYAVGYPEGVPETLRLQVGQGVVGAAVEEGRPILVNDIRDEPRYMGPLRNMLSQLAVPLRRKGKVIGALNLLNEVEGAFTTQDEALLRQFAAHAILCLRLYQPIQQIRQADKVHAEALTNRLHSQRHGQVCLAHSPAPER